MRKQKKRRELRGAACGRMDHPCPHGNGGARKQRSLHRESQSGIVAREASGVRTFCFPDAGLAPTDLPIPEDEDP